MKKQYQNLNKTFFVVFSLIVFFSVQLLNPVQSTAQSIFSNNPQSYSKDDKSLCEGTNAPRKDNKYCVYYIGYRDSETVNPSLAAEYRNKMLYVVKEEIDDYYNAYKNGRKVKTRWFQTLLDILGIGLAFTGTVAGGERVKTVLGATSGSFQAGRNSLNDRFQLLQYQILINKMNANRLEQWTEIVKNMEKDIKDFPWDSSREQLQQYLFRGNFEDALDTLVNETGADVATAEKNLNILGAVPKTELDAKVINFKDYIVPLLTKSKKLDTDIRTLTDQISTLPDGTEKEEKSKQLEGLNNKKKNLLDNYKNIWLAIVASGNFEMFDEKIRAKFGSSSAVINKYDEFLAKFKTKPADVTAEEFDFALTKVNAVAGEDKSLNEVYLTILKKYTLPEEN